MAKVIMVQGTMSGVGKSLVAAGLCRIFRQDGYRAAPFKSQNMAMNSFVTKEGLEMGRAQVLQAQAAGAEPVVEMNPVLLKPTSDTGSQVIVNGKVLCNMDDKEYFHYKKELIPVLLTAFQKLQKDYDIIVLEGAGSPAEINLKEDDIPNMGMAELADAPVLLVGDIERGGVFAQLFGTLFLLTEEEKQRVKGLVINKFRGDKSILEPGIAMLEEKTGVPVLGTVPYLKVDLEEEDSVLDRWSRREKKGVLDIAVICLPGGSNYTDFMVLESSKAINMRYIEYADELEKPDLVILPGTKNTMGDLRWMRSSGMEAAVLQAKNAGSVILGVCGGFQMLGQWLKDSEKTEEGGAMRGIGLLPMETVFGGEKVRTVVAGNFEEISGPLAALSGQPIEGYEIHMGVSCRTPMNSMEEDGSLNGDISQGAVESGIVQGENVSVQPVLRLTDRLTGEEKLDGMQLGNVYGTYVHGIFDRAEVRENLIKALAANKGIRPGEVKEISLKEYREEQLDILAENLRKHLDMEYIYRILNGEQNGDNEPG